MNVVNSDAALMTVRMGTYGPGWKLEMKHG